MNSRQDEEISTEDLAPETGFYTVKMIGPDNNIITTNTHEVTQPAKYLDLALRVDGMKAASWAAHCSGCADLVIQRPGDKAKIYRVRCEEVAS